jgi:hypothetical protein
MLGTSILLVIILLIFQLYWNTLVQNIPPVDKDEPKEEKNVPNLR